MITALDTNVIIDVLEPDPKFGPASRAALRTCLREGSVVGCEVVWAEVMTAFADNREEVAAAVQADRLLTRDRRSYRDYLRALKLVVP